MQVLGLSLETWAIIIPSIVTIANVITAATPTKIDDEIWGKIYNPLSKVFNVLSINFGHNKNADDK